MLPKCFETRNIILLSKHIVAFIKYSARSLLLTLLKITKTKNKNCNQIVKYNCLQSCVVS